ncbi:MAG: RNA methyltransferase [Rhodocyclaceae bacterium]|nr:MAG: RNA methyltransferase [Rhodocyclaceae bacterium]
MSDPRYISSRDNQKFKELRGLTDDPRRHGRTVVDGIHLVSTCFARGVGIRQLLASESGQRNPEIAALLQRASGFDCMVLRDSLFREISGVGTPTGIAAVIDIPPVPEGKISGDAVLLDAVQDAGNVGAILRTAAAAGVRDVLLGPGCAGAWTPRVLRAGQGAHFSLAIREQVDLVAALGSCSGTSIATVACGGTNLYELDLAGPIAWLVGNEGAGLSAELVAAAGACATIPLAGGSESLNVAAAAAVCLFEASRQRAMHGSAPRDTVHIQKAWATSHQGIPSPSKRLGT